VAVEEAEVEVEREEEEGEYSAVAVAGPMAMVILKGMVFCMSWKLSHILS